MNIRKANPADYTGIMHVWESSILATHHFLKEEDFRLFKSMIPGQVLPALELYVIGDTYIAGVLGGGNLEMPLVEAGSRGKGYG